MNRLRFFSFMFLVLITLSSAFLLNAAAGFFSTEKGESESVPLDNTLVVLNDLYEQLLMIRLSELENQQAELQRRLEQEAEIAADEYFNTAYEQLQAERAKLRSEMDFVKQEAVRLNEGESDTADEELHRELAQLRESYDAGIAELESRLNESIELNRQLSGEIDMSNEEAGVLESMISDLRSTSEKERLRAQELESELEALRKDSAALDEQLTRTAELLAAQESERLDKERLLELELEAVKIEYYDAEQACIVLKNRKAELDTEIETLRSEYNGLQTGYNELQAEHAELKNSSNSGELEEIISRLFTASDISGVFIGIAGGGVRAVVNPDSAAAAVESPFLSVYRDDGEEISKIILSEDGGDYQFRVYPGYPEPVEGNWF